MRLGLLSAHRHPEQICASGSPILGVDLDDHAAVLPGDDGQFGGGAGYRRGGAGWSGIAKDTD